MLLITSYKFTMEKKESKIEEVSAIKMSMSSLHYKGIDIKNTYKRCIEALLAYYYEFQDTKFLEVAYKYIEAFLDTGFMYNEYSELFNIVIDLLGITYEEVNAKNKSSFPKLKLNKHQIKNVIRRWSPSKYHTMPINEVIDDIIFKVKNKEIGIYSYSSNAKPGITEDDLSNDTYELIITPIDAYFRDIRRGIFYTLEED